MLLLLSFLLSSPDVTELLLLSFCHLADVTSLIVLSSPDVTHLFVTRTSERVQEDSKTDIVYKTQIQPYRLHRYLYYYRQVYTAYLCGKLVRRQGI